jgi:protocatechuate 3,4-dioxygenase alpha subunit
MPLTPTPSQTVGPYLHLGLTDSGAIARIASEHVKGEPIHLTCKVLDGDGLPVPDAMIELWQADAEGKYPGVEELSASGVEPAFRGFGRMPTREDGTCNFETIKPGRVQGPEGELQAPHINVSVLGRGLLVRLCTRIYFAGDPANESDPVLALVPQARRSTLLAQQDSPDSRSWLFEIRLCGDDETVFFDL